MKTVTEINNKIRKIQRYLDECELKGVCSTGCEISLHYLKCILESSEDEVARWWISIKEKVAPYFYYDQRKELKNKQEEFYRRNISGRSRTSKSYEKLMKQYYKMDVPEYNEYDWELYKTLGWVLGEKDNKGVLLHI